MHTDRIRRAWTLALLLACMLPASRAPAQEAPQEDLMGLELEQLLDLEVTSVSKRRERRWSAAAAIAVITQEDIARLGVQSLPEALRSVPGMEVARINANKWAVSSRGFNAQFANKLLVLQDGRVLYTPLFAGTFWDVQDTLLQDIDRIEVIRGPGAVLWGANAVNGVVNIITRSAEETLGGLVYGTVGSEEHGAGGVRYGMQLAEDLFARVYVKYFNRDDFSRASGGSAGDEWEMLRGGFRADWRASEQDHLTFQGDVYGADIGEEPVVIRPLAPFVSTRPGHQDVSGGNVLARWTRTFDERSELKLQVYYDRTSRDTEFFREQRNTVDLDVQFDHPLGDAHELVWGAEYRVTWDDIDGTFSLSFDPDSRTDELFSAFVQDDIEILPDSFFLTAGIKIEHNDYSGFEIQPGLRMRWLPDEDQVLWGAVSRAVSSPSREKHDIQAPFGFIPDPAGGSPTIPTLIGDPDVEAEQLWAFELGYRVRPVPALSLDLALFYNDYEDVVGIEPGTPFLVPGPAPYILQPLLRSNVIDGETYGIELAADWRVNEWLRLSGSYSFLQLQLHAPTSSDPVTNEAAEGDSPHHRFHLRSDVELTDDLALTLALYYADTLPAQGIPSHLRLDAQIRWQPSPDLTLVLGAQNLLDDRHPEFESSFATTAREVDRLVYLSLELRF